MIHSRVMSGFMLNMQLATKPSSKTNHGMLGHTSHFSSDPTTPVKTNMAGKSPFLIGPIHLQMVGVFFPSRCDVGFRGV